MLSSLRNKEVTVTQPNCLPTEGFVRLPDIIAPRGPLPISRSSWWAGVKDGRFPKPVKLGLRIAAWRVEDVRNLIQRLGRSA
jgi:prophage regulatory protein